MRIVLAITGASGAIYGITLLKLLVSQKVETHLLISAWARKTIELETEYKADDIIDLASYYYQEEDQAAAISSGSFKTQGMIIAPCSMKTLAGISHGMNNNLIGRAADVTLKERRKLVLVPREAPLNNIHLENMLKVAQAGAIIFPPVPAFYNRPEKIQDLVEHTAGRILDQFDLAPASLPRWSG